ncbi:MAG: hypothetical protein PVH89_01135 [Gammaproteobacteria bacterium]|jgi:hypothetical protein
MIHSEPPIEAVGEVRQLNRLFLDFLRDQPAGSADRFRLSARAAALLCRAEQHEIVRAASFPRALFGLCLPPAPAVAIEGQPAPAPGERVIQLVVLHSARNLARMSGYWARLLLRLDDSDVQRLRGADVEDIVAMSEVDGVLCAAFGVLDRVLPELLTEPHAEQRRRLLLLGFQPELLRPAAAETA